MDTLTMVVLLLGGLIIFMMIAAALIGKSNKKETNEYGEEIEDTEEEVEETYNFSNNCQNCEGHYEYDIPMGKTVEEYLKDKKCVDCGCNLRSKNRYTATKKEIITEED